jgi:hypothetical protein
MQGLFQSRLGTADYALVTSSLHYNDSLFTRTVVHMTAAKFKPLIFYIISVAVAVNLRPTVSWPNCPGVRRLSGCCDQFKVWPLVLRDFDLGVTALTRPRSNFTVIYRPVLSSERAPQIRQDRNFQKKKKIT